MKRAALVPLLMAGAMTLTSAQADNVVVGFQQTSCGQWTQARASHQSAEMEFWAMGFVSGAANWRLGLVSSIAPLMRRRFIVGLTTIAAQNLSNFFPVLRPPL